MKRPYNTTANTGSSSKMVARDILAKCAAVSRTCVEIIWPSGNYRIVYL
jgi:hypothetical protein